MSSIVKVAVVDVALPQSSVAVNVTVAAPVAPQSSLNASKSFVHITPPHASVAVAPPLLSSQFERSTLLPAPSHSTVASAAAITSGAVVSSMVNVAVVDVALPQSSVAVKVTVAAPVAPQSSLNASKSFVHITPPHASVAVAPPLLSSHVREVNAVARTVAFDRSVCRSHYVWSRRVFDRERRSCRRGVAAVVRRSERDRRCACCTAIVTQRVEVVRPHHAAACIRRCRAAVAVKPVREVNAVARAVAFDRSVCRSHYVWSCRVFDREGRRCRRGVAAVVRRSEGDRRCACSTAIVTQRVEVVRPHHAAACIRRCRAAVAVKPVREVNAVARAVAFDRSVCRSHYIWSCRVFDRERRRCRRGVAAIVRRSERDRRCACCTAIVTQRVEVVRPHHAAACIRRCRAAVAVKPVREVAAVARTVAFDRSVCRSHYVWSRRVFDREGRRCRRGVAAIVRRSEGDRRCACSTAIVTQRVEVVRPHHTAACIRRCRAAVAVKPVREVAAVARAVAFDRSVHCRHVDGWGRGVFDHDGL